MKYGIGIIVVGLFVSSSVLAGNLPSVPNTFSSGTAAKASEVNANFEAVRVETDDNATEITALKATIDNLVKLSCGPGTGVYFGGRCYYLDGSGGVCESGFKLAPQSVLASIAPQFVGLTNRTAQADNCCIEHADTATEGQDWGMGAPDCGSAGPFETGPVLGAASCTDVDLHSPTQLTLCMSIN